jgi:hypothetical protein
VEHELSGRSGGRLGFVQSTKFIHGYLLDVPAQPGHWFPDANVGMGYFVSCIQTRMPSMLFLICWLNPKQDAQDRELLGCKTQLLIQDFQFPEQRINLLGL